MLGQFEEKGKIYTQVISKEPMEVMIQTTSQRIQGKVYIRHGERLKDQIDKDERYLAVTDAQIFDLGGNLLYTSGFLGVQHDCIQWIAPLDDMILPEESHE